MIAEAASLAATIRLVSDSFKSVFEEVSHGADSWISKTALLTTGRKKLARFICESVGQFRLFASSREVLVDNVYVRVLVSDRPRAEEYSDQRHLEEYLIAQKAGDIRDLRSAVTPLEALQQGTKGFALAGTAGSGKTTAFRFLALQAAKGVPIRGRQRVPFFLTVRDLALRDQSISGAAVSLLADMGVGEAERVLGSLLSDGRGLLLVDGLDEADKGRQLLLLDELKRLRERYAETIVCVSSRPQPLAVDLSGFARWETVPLLLEERLNFVSRWFEQVDAHKGELLIGQCKNSPSVLDLGSNPLLLSIVCALFNNDLQLPHASDELYERAIEGLLGGWDAFRTIARQTPLAGLTPRRRTDLASWLAHSLLDRGMIVFSARDLDATGVLGRAAKRFRIPPPSAEELLASLYGDFGLVVECAPRLYSFTHLTIQEYLAARYIVDLRLEVTLARSRVTNHRWAEVIRIVARLLPRADDFMERLGRSAPIEVALAAWETGPSCQEAVVGRLLGVLAARIRKERATTDWGTSELQFGGNEDRKRLERRLSAVCEFMGVSLTRDKS